jgi:DNA-binding transcriptional LysR family regulator
LKIETLGEFVTLIKRRSFTDAAKELHMSQPGLSTHINALEKELGYRLVERGANTVSLTPAGVEFLKYAQRILDVFEEADAVCRKISQAPKPLRVRSFRPSLPYYPALMRLREKHPFDFVDLDADKSFLNALEKGLVDISLSFDFSEYAEASDNGEYGTVCFTPIGSGKAGICIMKTHPLAHRKQLSRKDLEGATVVINSGANFDIWRKAVQRMIGEGVDLKFRLNPVYSLQSLASIDMGDDLHICGFDFITENFSWREDVKVYSELDGEELRFTESFAFLKGNEAAACLAQDLQRELHYNQVDKTQ